MLFDSDYSSLKTAQLETLQVHSYTQSYFHDYDYQSGAILGNLAAGSCSGQCLHSPTPTTSAYLSQRKGGQQKSSLSGLWYSKIDKGVVYMYITHYRRSI